MPTLTVVIANSGTQLSSGGVSAVGHMYYVISNGSSETLSFGFAPDSEHHGDAFAPGAVYTNDASEYITSNYSATFEITQDQYNNLKDFGKYPGKYGFDMGYNGLTNSCVDFTWKGLNLIGLNSSGFEGDLLPVWNSDELHELFKDLKSHALYEIASQDYSSSPQLTVTQYSFGGTEYLGVTFIDAMGNNLGEYFPGGTVTVEPLTGENGEILDSRTFTSDSAGFYEALDTAISTSGYIDYIGSNTNIVGINNSNGIYSSNFVGGVLAAGNIANTGDYLSPLSMMYVYDATVGFLSNNDYGALMDQMVSDSIISNYVSAVYGLSTSAGGDTYWAFSLYFDFHKALFPNLEFDEWVVNFSNDFAANGSPIAIDLSGDGIQTTSIMTGAVNFDITGDGQKERTAWLSGRDGFLAHDDNHNGQIDNISELFGGLGRGDGYAKLSEWDTNADSIINILDAGYKQLSIWQDVNQNGLTDTGELRSLSEVGLTSLSLSYSVQDSLSNGNFIGELSNAQVNGSIVEMGDVYFQYYPTNSSKADLNETYSSELIAAAPNQPKIEKSDYENTSSVARTLSASDARVAADSSVVLQQVQNAIQESKYQAGLSDRIQAYLGEIALIVNGSGVVIDYTKLQASFNQAISSNYDLGVKDLVNFNLLEKGYLAGWDGWGLLSNVLSSKAFSEQMIDFLNGKNVKVLGFGGFDGAGSSLSEIIIGNVAGNILKGNDGDDEIYGLSGNDNISGGNGKDVVYGGSGNDILNGGAGNDTLVGGDGNDIYMVDSTTDTITETATGGVDTVQSSVTYALGATSNLEGLTLSGASAINGTGNTLNNIITGNAASNVLNGGSGTDTLIGGDGNDTYIVDTTTDTITEAAAGGVDTVQSSVTYTLGASSNLENLTLTGTTVINGTGNALNNVLTGNAANNTLTGGTGNDTLNGGAGTDTLIGGDGNDIYIVDSTTDIITETTTGGVDTVQSSVSFTLGASSNLESLTLTGASAINATGNALDNVLTGNSANNTLTGGAGKDTLNGGAGTDTLIGGDGNDIYVVDTTTDTITETATGGLDTVQSSVTFTLGASSNLESLSLTGVAAINGTGNALSNFLLGNSANNTLTDTAGGNDILQGLAGVDTVSDTAGNNLIDGGVGADVITTGSGRDIIVGGKDNDIITIGTSYDVIVFNKGDGADTINASVGTDNTLSLGGNFAYSDLSLTKSTNDLILKMGASDQITFKGWYDTAANNKSVLNMQVIAEAMQGFSQGGSDTLRNNKVETFKFANLVAAFDAAGATTNWQLTDARLTAHLSAGSDTAAIGGDMAYQYGKIGSLAGVGLLAAQAVINNASVGQSAQALNASTSWATETTKLT